MAQLVRLQTFLPSSAGEANLLCSPESARQDEDEIAVSQTLLPAIALLSAHLTFLRTTLPTASVAAIYRRIASSIAEHVLQRAILYRGRLSLQEGRR